MQSYSHLSDDERDQIGILRAAGRSMGAIARALGRAKATISRELQRNALPLGGYSPLHAAGAYQLRRRREAMVDSEVRCNPVDSIGSSRESRVPHSEPPPFCSVSKGQRRAPAIAFETGPHRQRRKGSTAPPRSGSRGYGFGFAR